MSFDRYSVIQYLFVLRITFTDQKQTNRNKASKAHETLKPSANLHARKQQCPYILWGGSLWKTKKQQTAWEGQERSAPEANELLSKYMYAILVFYISRIRLVT